MCIEKTNKKAYVVSISNLKAKKTIETEIQAWQNVKFEVTRFDLTHVLLKKTLEDRQKERKKLYGKMFSKKHPQ